MVNAFTDYARSSAQNPESLNFNQMLETISVLYHENNSDVSIKLELENELPPILADGVRLRQLVHNLVKNSLETIGENGWIRLQTRCVREQGRQFVEFVVEDSGEGVASEIAENLFEPYVTTKTTGSGLGLAIVQKIVDEHSGLVWVEKGEGGGAKFIVRLPLLLPVNDDSISDVKIDADTNSTDVKVMP